MKRVSAIVFSYFETSHLTETLNSLYWCDEILLVTDKLRSQEFPEIFELFNLTILHHPYADFHELRKYAVEKSKYNLVLLVNSNELLPEKLVKEMVDELIIPADIHGYFFKVSTSFLGQELPYGNQGEKKELRMFDKRWVTFHRKPAPRDIVLYGNHKILREKLIRKNADDVHEFISCLNLQSTLAQKEYVNKKQMPLFFLAISLPLYFLYDFIFKRNFLNKRHGFYWSAFKTWFFFMKQVKKSTLYRSLYEKKTPDYRPQETDQAALFHEEFIPILYSEN